MTTAISLREANQGFSRCIRAVEAGEDFIITRNGKPVAKLVPVEGRRIPTPEQLAAWERLKASVDPGDLISPGLFDRDALHER